MLLRSASRSPANAPTSVEFKRVLSWQSAFWITSGAATAGLFGIGEVAAIAGKAALPIVVTSSLIGFLQLFLYAELAGIFPNKTGGGSIYASVAWRRYGKIFLPINVGSYWFGITTSLTIFSSLIGAYIVSAFFQGTFLESLSVTLLDLSGYLPGITFALDGPIVIGAAVLIGVFAIQHSGVSQAARSQTIIGAIALVPLIILIFGPLAMGKIRLSNIMPVDLPGATSITSAEGLGVLAAALYVSGWATYGCEQAVAYIAEFKNPERDGVRALVSSGLLGMLLFIGLPLSLIGVLGLGEVTTPDFLRGFTQEAFLKLAASTFGEASAVLIILSLCAAIVIGMGTIMASSSRTLYQGARDGIFPRHLGKLNAHGVPGRGMWADLLVNLVLLLLGNPLFVLAAGNVAYLLCVAMDICAVRMLRTQLPDAPRPYRAPDWLALYVGPLLGLFNIAIILIGANRASPNALWYGLAVISIICITFLYRHYILDGGALPNDPLHDADAAGSLVKAVQ